ncbi:MAG: ABC transporter ATP-binding protein [Sulfurovum sp.]|nr:ABC transporter ATP-binding protein [Sulfurovum sp.]MDD3602749.1 ABC transporter ATP-binding protein [Sulfurovum sp.]
MTNVIEIENLNLTFSPNTPQEFHALKNISLSVKEGEFCILKGVSGSGKSTLLSVMGALLKPTSGKLEVFSSPVSKMPDFHASTFRREHLGFIFQNFNLFDEFTVLENVQTALVPTNAPVAHMQTRALALLSMVNLEKKKDTTARNLSGGEKQRCAIARALINNPKLILADEPTANLDRKNSENVIEILTKLNSQGTTVLVATHDEIFEQMIPDLKVIHIKEGAIV